MTCRMFGAAAVTVAILVGAAACSSSHMAGDDAGSGGEACGPATCEVGQVCCNESCGICTEPGGSCIEIACVDGGSPPLDGGGTCGSETCGSGEICCPGCGDAYFCASGTVCPDVDCPPSCTPEDPFACPEGSFCDYPDRTCGGVGLCQPSPGGCDLDCPGVCGCNGVTYCNVCTAQANGVDVGADGPCEVSPGCEAQDARSEGVCEVFVGWAWNGTDCYTINCSCVGADCGDLYSDFDACRLAHEGCTGAVCGGFGGIPCGATHYCDYDDGCGFDDGTGRCLPRPDVCAGIVDPVCGCDGVTYDNACLAFASGQDVQYRGPCLVPG